MKELLVFVPTRHRPDGFRRCADSFRETVAGDVDLLAITDDDDDSYSDLGDGAVIVQRDRLSAAVNKVVVPLSSEYRALMLVSDDQVFVTPGWDKILLNALDELGGTGMVYPDDKRRADIPELILISSDIVQALGWFMEPSMAHFYVDNAWADIGRHAQCLRFCPDAVIRHDHYSVCSDIPHDAVYQEAETAHGENDRQAYLVWRREKMDADVAKVMKLLRKKRAAARQ